MAAERKERGAFLAEYVGEVVDEPTMERRLGDASSAQEQHFYMMELSNGLYVDSRTKGNFTRFVNHCCDPNAECQSWRVGAETRVAIFAVQTIEPGDEITYDYKWFSKRRYACHCGAARCKGFFGGDDTTLSTAGSDDESGEVLDGAGAAGGRPVRNRREAGGELMQHGGAAVSGSGGGSFRRGRGGAAQRENAVALWRTGGEVLHEVPPAPFASLRAARRAGVALIGSLLRPSDADADTENARVSGLGSDKGKSETISGGDSGSESGI